MLPPVRAISAVTEVQVPASQPVMASRPAVPAAISSTDAAALPMSGGRLGAMSLSAQLQLAQSVSVFAETIGALLKLPREPNEALPDYAQRIVAAVQALSPPDRALLEKALNQLVRGVTLRLLADLMQNPSGRETARLAAALEMSQWPGKDLAAKSAVTSYLQNEAGPTAFARPPANGTAAPAPPAAAGLASAPSTAPPISLPASMASNAGQGAADRSVIPSLPPAAAVPSSGGATPMGPFASGSFAASPAPALTEPAVPGPMPPGSGGVSPPVAATDAQPGRPASPDALPAADDPQVTLATIKADAVAAATALARLPAPSGAVPAATDLAAAMAPSPGGQVTLPAGAQDTAQDDLPAVLQAAGVPLEADPGGSLSLPDMARAARALGQNAVLAMTQWLADNLSGGTSPRPSPEMAAQLPGSGPETLIAQLTVQPAPPAAPLAATPHPLLDPLKPAPDPDAAPVAGDGPPVDPIRTATILPSKTAAPLQPDAREVAAMVVPVPVPREGVPLPFIPYPPAREQKQDRQGRKTPSVTKVDEEGDEPPARGQQQFPEREQSKGKDGQDAGGKPGGEEPADGDGSAHDFYWRMAGWT